MLERLVDDMAKNAHLIADQILVKYLKVEALRVLGETASLVLFRYKLNIAPLGHVFKGLAVQSLVNQLVEVLFHVVSFALPPLLCIVVNVRLKDGTGRIADGAVHSEELHSAIEVESK